MFRFFDFYSYFNEELKAVSMMTFTVLWPVHFFLFREGDGVP